MPELPSYSVRFYAGLVKTSISFPVSQLASGIQNKFS